MRLTTVYNAEGEAFEVDNLNALDLTRHSGFFFKNPKGTTAIPAPVETVAPVATVSEDAAPDADATVAFATLEDEAKVVADTDNLEAYLNTKDVAALRTYAEKHYGEKVHGRTGKDKLIEMILGWEAAKIDASEEAIVEDDTDE